jgi:transposase-like protein
VDTSRQSLSEVRLRRRWTVEEKRKIAEETFQPGGVAGQNGAKLRVF